jgi:hypothetical protein
LGEEMVELSRLFCELLVVRLGFLGSWFCPFDDEEVDEFRLRVDGAGEEDIVDDISFSFFVFVFFFVLGLLVLVVVMVDWGILLTVLLEKIFTSRGVQPGGGGMETPRLGNQTRTCCDKRWLKLATSSSTF